MAANIPDMGAVAHLGGQFQHNVFHTIEKKAHRAARKLEVAHGVQTRREQAAQQKHARGQAQAAKKAASAYNQQQKAQQRQAQQAAKAHAAGVKSGRVAPAPGAPPRIFAMKPTPQAKAQQKQQATQTRTMQQQKNFAHGEALKFQATQFKVKQQQIKYAHGQAIQEANKRAKGGPVNTATTPKAPSLAPSFSAAPTTHTSPVKPQRIAATTFSSQLQSQKPLQGTRGNVTASFSSGPIPNMPSSSMERSGSVTGPQFPQHTHPEGSSTAPLPRLTASQPKPNQFTVGSRNVKPLGIAAKGSQLETWAMQRQADVRKQRGSDNTQLRLGD